MFPTLFTTALFAALAIQGALAFTIDTPAFTQCQDTQITWGATKGPYNLIIVPAADPCGNALADLGDHDGTSMTYKVAIPAGTQVQLSLQDAAGDEAWSGTITVAKSADSSCLKKGTSTGSSTTSSGSTLIVTPTLTVSQPSTNASPVGAAGNAGANPFSNDAITLRQASTPIMVLAAVAAVFATSL